MPSGFAVPATGAWKRSASPKSHCRCHREFPDLDAPRRPPMRARTGDLPGKLPTILQHIPRCRPPKTLMFTQAMRLVTCSGGRSSAASNDAGCLRWSQLPAIIVYRFHECPNMSLMSVCTALSKAYGSHTASAEPSPLRIGGLGEVCLSDTRCSRLFGSPPSVQMSRYFDVIGPTTPGHRTGQEVPATGEWACLH